MSRTYAKRVGSFAIRTRQRKHTVAGVESPRCKTLEKRDVARRNEGEGDLGLGVSPVVFAAGGTQASALARKISAGPGGVVLAARGRATH
eukprot:1193021-Prymnesium_polylepis.1